MVYQFNELFYDLDPNNGDFVEKGMEVEGGKERGAVK